MRNLQLMLSMVVMLANSACFYDPDLSKISEDSAEEAVSDSSSADAGAVDAGENGNFSGLGTVCHSTDECAGYAADYCLLDPTSPDSPGICTTTDCDTKGCPNAYQCCDCSGVGMEIMCVSDDSVAAVSAFCQCS